MTAIGRWGGIDPLMEKHISYNPYNYVLNNTLILIGPDGKQVRTNQNKQAYEPIGGGSFADPLIGLGLLRV